MEERDTILYSVGGGVANLEVLSRDRFSREEKNLSLVSPVFRAVGYSFVDVVNGLIDYHNDCVIAHNEGKKQLYFGAGSDRGEWVNRELRPWKIANTLPLLGSEMKLLEGIVGMHNNICYNNICYHLKLLSPLPRGL